MALKIGINGFGRIGRLVFRSAMKQSDVSIVAVNDLLDVNHLAYLLKYDSVHGPYEGEVSVNGNNLFVDGQEIHITAQRNPAEIGWRDMGVEIVAECTGIFTLKLLLIKPLSPTHLALLIVWLLFLKSLMIILKLLKD